MRRPSTSAELLATWSAMLAAERRGGKVYGASPLQDWDFFGVGWFQTRFVKNGPPVPVRTWVEREICPETGELMGDEVMRVEIDGRRCRKLPEPLIYRAISREAYDRMVAAARDDIRLQAVLAPMPRPSDMPPPAPPARW
jgi:hypothetical protein